MKIKAIVLNVNKYDFADPKTGEILTGAKVHYLISNGSEPAVLSVNKHQKNISILPKLRDFPAIYELTMKHDVRKGQIVQVVGDLDFVKKVDLMSLL